jgi:hypothetical protein
MSNLISVTDFEFTQGNKLSSQSVYLNTAVNRLLKKNKFKNEDDEKVIDLLDLILEMNNIHQLNNKMCNNKNGVKK